MSRRDADLGPMNDRVRIERPVADTAFRGAGKGAWVEVDKAWADVQDTLPSRSERPAGGMPAAVRSARVRMRYRDGITSDMRFVLGDRVMQIVSGPAELGRKRGLEFVVEDYTPAGNAA